MRIKTKPILRGRLTEDNTIRATFRGKEYAIDAAELGDLELIDTMFVDPTERPGEVILIFKGTLEQADTQPSDRLKLVS